MIQIRFKSNFNLKFNSDLICFDLIRIRIRIQLFFSHTDLSQQNHIYILYSVSSFIDVGQAGFYIYSKECRSGGGSIQSIGFDTSLTIADNGQDVTPGSETNVNDITMSKSVTVPVTVNELTMSDNSNIYADLGQNQYKIEFCLVFYLNTLDGSLEVNQQETLVTIDIDLSDLAAVFRVDAFDVGTKDRNQVDTEDIVYSPIAYLCNIIDGSDLYATTANTAIFTQGDMINVCVKPNQAAITDNIKIKSIESLTFSRDNGGGNGDDGNGLLNQDAVLNSIASTNGLSTYNDIDCYGKDYCSVSTILISSFFTTPGTVSGNGEASLTFYSDAERNLLASSNDLETRTINENEDYNVIIHHHRSLQDTSTNTNNGNNDNNNNDIVDGAIPSFVMDLNVIPADDSPTMFPPTSSASASTLALATRQRRRVVAVVANTSNHDYYFLITVVPNMIIMISIMVTVGLLIL